MPSKPRVLIVEARFYEELADFLKAGAIDALRKAGAVYEVMAVPGALEIPPAIKFAKDHFDGFVALGCVLRGETSHYDIVCNESARGLMDLAVHYDLAIGNGILTCETEAQALERADPARMNKGGGAVEAVLRLLEVRKGFLS